MGLFICLISIPAFNGKKQDASVFRTGKTHGMMMVIVMNKVLGRENYEIGRRLCLGPAGDSER